MSRRRRRAVRRGVGRVRGRRWRPGSGTLLGATYALATTGVAGPDRQEGHPVGTRVGRRAPVRAACETRLLAPGRGPGRRPGGDAVATRCRCSMACSTGKNRASGSVGPHELRHDSPSTRKDKRMVLFRRLLGDVLRSERMQRGMTLREVSAEARVSLGYISEIERGQKEASSELLASLCAAMDLPLSDVLREVVRRRGGRGARAGLRRVESSSHPDRLGALGRRRRGRLRRLTRSADACSASAWRLAARAPVRRALAPGLAHAWRPRSVSRSGGTATLSRR